MGKASRRRKDLRISHVTDPQAASARHVHTEQVPFVRRPFEGLPGETDWVAFREIVPAATAPLTLADGSSATLATLLPMAWPGLHRADGTVLIAAQTAGSSGDASRDLAAQLLATRELEAGQPLQRPPAVTSQTPRLQDLLDPSVPLDVTVHEGVDFWVEGQELEGEARQSLDQANARVIPTTKLDGTDSAYWSRIGARTHIRLVLPDDEDDATDALARLWAAGAAGLGGPTRILGAFRAGGLLVPVWDLDPAEDASAYAEPLAGWVRRYRDALAAGEPLTAEERRAKSGFLSRQVTLR